MDFQVKIDATKYDIRMLPTSATDSEDAGVVNGVPFDPPDDLPGWVMHGIHIEHDSEQVKGEKGAVTTKLVNSVYYVLWVRPKPPKPKVKAESKSKSKSKGGGDAPPPSPSEGGKKRGRKRRGQETPPTPPEPPPPGNEEDGDETNVLDALNES